MRRLPYVLVPFACFPCASIFAQEQPSAPNQSCDGKLVSEIIVERQPPTLITRTVPPWVRPVAIAAVQHKTSKASAIRPFLQVEPGKLCSSFRLAESERVLRAQPYLADADVRAVPDDSGGVRVVVSTVDEIPIVLGVGLRGGGVSSVTYGNSNIMGDGLYGAVEWRQGFAYRDGVGGRFENFHAFGGANMLTVVAERFPLTSDYVASLTHPFYTQFQRLGWYTGVSRSEGYVSFTRPEGAALSLPITRTRWDVGGIFRLGGRNGHFFAGPLFTHYRLTPETNEVILTDTGLVQAVDQTLVDRYPRQRTTRLAAVLGVRLLSYLKVTGFDALTGPQDLGVGMQLVTTVGRGIGSGAHDEILGADLYAGWGSPTSFLALRTQWETQREPSNGKRWVDFVGSGRLAWYRRVGASGTYLTSVEFSGGWRQRTPFQLRLGDARGGLRGYHDSHIAGARRLVLRAERRWVLGGLTRFDNFGIAAFSDVGRTWAGQVPFGVNSGVKASLGVGLLLAVPKESRRLLRVDFAAPLVHDPHAGFEVRVSASAPLAGLWREPSDVARVRSLIPSANVFDWP